MEDFPTTMKAFESLIPRFFMGANVLYDKANQALHEHSKTAHRKGNFVLVPLKLTNPYSEPDPDTVEYLKKGLKREYELYEYIKEIFYQKVQFLKDKNLWE